MQYPRVDIEQSFAKCVRAIGGQVLDSVLGGARSFKNADYYFPRDGVIAELKVLSEDILQKADFKRAAGDLHEKWEREGRIKPNPVGVHAVNSRDLPPECARELLGLLKARLESSAIKKANKQIRDTKAHFKAPNAVGLLILANDGNFAFKPDVLFHILDHSLRKQFRSIDAVVFFTANEPLALPGFESHGAQLWTDLVVPGRRTLPDGFAKRLGEEWRRLYSELISGIVIDVEVAPPSPQDMGKVDFINKRTRRSPPT